MNERETDPADSESTRDISRFRRAFVSLTCWRILVTLNI